MSWSEPQWAWLTVALVLLAAVIVGMGRVHAARLGTLFKGDLLERVWPAAVRRRRVVRDTALLLGLLGLTAALAEPRFGKQLAEVKAEGVDLVLVVDLSSSMDASDVDPTRLERAQREILDLIDLLEGDRVGLVIFAGGAYPRMPLTLDYKALALLVRELDTRTFEAQGSALDEALRTAADLLDDPTSQAGKAVLVLSDGEVHRPDDALTAARSLADAGVAVFGLVIGNESAPVPNGDGTFLIDRSTGQRVISTPTPDLLTEIARATGGAVVQSVASNADVAQLYQGEIRGKVRAAVGRTSQRERWQSAFQWPLGIGVLLLLMSAWIGDGRRVGLVVVALLALAQPAWAQTVREGDALYRAGRYDEAVHVFTELSLAQPDDPDVLGRLGSARYRAGDFDGAARAFARQSELTGDADSAFNAGNAYVRSGRLDEALERYDDALQRQPDHPGAARNRQLVAQEILQRRQQQQQQQQQQSSDDPQQGEPQEGEQQGEPQQGEPQQGEPQEGDQQGDQQQDGDPQEGEPQQGEPKPGDPSEGQQGEPEPADGTREEDDPTQDGQVSLDELDDQRQDPSEDGAGQGGAPTEGEPGDDTTDVSASQAERVLDGVEEGHPRVVIPGHGGEKPW